MNSRIFKVDEVEFGSIGKPTYHGLGRMRNSDEQLPSKVPAKHRNDENSPQEVRKGDFKERPSPVESRGIRLPERTGAAKPPVAFPSSSEEEEIMRLTDKVADHLRNSYFPGKYDGIQYIRKNLSENPNTLKEIRSRLRSNSRYNDVWMERVISFEEVVDLFMATLKG
jgi:hypothetical protein